MFIFLTFSRNRDHAVYGLAGEDVHIIGHAHFMLHALKVPVGYHI
jgi:hypothetical protein